MTEVAQVAAVVAHDVDKVTNEDEHTTSDAENQNDDETHEKDDAAEKKNKKTSHMEDEKSFQENDKASVKTDETHINGVEHKDGISEAVNGVAQDTETKEAAQPDTNEDQHISDLAIKKEVSEEFQIISDEKLNVTPLWKPFTPAAQIILPSFSLRNLRNCSDPESWWPEATCQS